MRVPNAGQPLDERRIVREGKQLAAAMLANYADPSWFERNGFARQASLWGQQLMGALRGLPVKD